MKKTTLTLLSVLCSVFLNSQSLNFSLANLSGTYSITCSVPIVSMAAVGTPTSVNYVWTGPNTSFSNNIVNLTNPGQYTVTATAGTVTSSQTLVIYSNTQIPVSVISPTLANITCTSGSATTFTALAISPTVQVAHQFVNPYGGTLTAGSFTAFYQPMAPGTYTHILTDSVNGCSTQKSFTVLGTGFPTFSLTGNQDFILGCATRSVIGINIINATTQPTMGPVSYTLLPPGTTTTLAGPLSFNSTYTVNIPGNWTAVVKDNTSGCEARVPISIIQKTLAPVINLTAIPTKTFSCTIPNTTIFATCNSAIQSFTWFGNSMSSSVSMTLYVQQPWNYQFSMMNIYACPKIANLTISGSNSITVTSPSVVDGLCFQPTVEIIPYGNMNAPYKFSWTSPAGASTVSAIGNTLITASAGIYTLTVNDTISSCKTVRQISVLDCVGLEEFADGFNVKLYPNPTIDLIHIESPDENRFSYRLLNLQGEEILNATEKENVLQLSDKPAGIYFLEINNEGIKKQIKVVKE